MKIYLIFFDNVVLQFCDVKLEPLWQEEKKQIIHISDYIESTLTL